MVWQQNIDIRVVCFVLLFLCWIHCLCCDDCAVRCSYTVFQRPCRCCSISLKVILSLSDGYKIFTSDWLCIEVCQKTAFSKIDITMTTINKKLRSSKIWLLVLFCHRSDMIRLDKILFKPYHIIFYVPLDNLEVSSSRHKCFAWNSKKRRPFSIVLGPHLR